MYLSGHLTGYSGLDDRVLVALEATDRRTALDARGMFGFDDLPPGDYVLVVTVGDEVVIRQAVFVRAEQTEQVELEIGR